MKMAVGVVCRHPIVGAPCVAARASHAKGGGIFRKSLGAVWYQINVNYRFLITAAVLATAALAATGLWSSDTKTLEKSRYFAFVGRDFIFTLEMYKPGVPILNFVSMVDTEYNLFAKEIRLTLESRKVPAKFFIVDTGNPKEPVIIPSVRMRPRSAFGVTLRGDFGEEKEPAGVTVRVGDEDLKLVPLASFDFENLALKVNRLNLRSPDFGDDWRILKLETLGTRERARR